MADEFGECYMQNNKASQLNNIKDFLTRNPLFTAFVVILKICGSLNPKYHFNSKAK